MKINPDEVFEECKSLLRSIGIPIASDDKISINLNLKSSKHAEAYCACHTDEYEIRLKKIYFTCKNPDIKHLKNLILHELVHTCSSCYTGRTSHEHTPLFLSYAKVIKDKLDYNILEFEDLSSYKCGNIPIKVMAYCKYCGCSIIFRSDKNIEKDFLAYLVYSHDDVAGPCPYCENIMQYKNISIH